MAGVYMKDGHRGYTSVAHFRSDRRYITPTEYTDFHSHGFLVARSLASPVRGTHSDLSEWLSREANDAPMQTAELTSLS